MSQQPPTVPRAGFTTGMQGSVPTGGTTPPAVGQLPGAPGVGAGEGIGVDTKFKFYFYCSPPSMNSVVNYSKRVHFRNHFYRTNDTEEAEYIRKELIDRGDTLAYKVEEVDEKEFLRRISLTGHEDAPRHPGEGVIEPLPGQSAGSGTSAGKEENKGQEQKKP